MQNLLPLRKCVCLCQCVMYMCVMCLLVLKVLLGSSWSRVIRPASRLPTCQIAVGLSLSEIICAQNRILVKFEACIFFFVHRFTFFFFFFLSFGGRICFVSPRDIGLLSVMRLEKESQWGGIQPAEAIGEDQGILPPGVQNQVELLWGSANLYWNGVQKVVRGRLEEHATLRNRKIPTGE